MNPEQSRTHLCLGQTLPMTGQSREAIYMSSLPKIQLPVKFLSDVYGYELIGPCHPMPSV